MIIEIKKELRNHPELIEDNCGDITANDNRFLSDCNERLEAFRRLGFKDIQSAIANVVADWEDAELIRLGIRQRQGW